jgi:hypothetical protein
VPPAGVTELVEATLSSPTPAVTGSASAGGTVVPSPTVTASVGREVIATPVAAPTALSVPTVSGGDVSATPAPRVADSEGRSGLGVWVLVAGLCVAVGGIYLLVGRRGAGVR